MNEEINHWFSSYIDHSKRAASLSAASRAYRDLHNLARSVECQDEAADSHARAVTARYCFEAAKEVA